MTSPFWGNCPGCVVKLRFCEQHQGGSGFKPFPDACSSLSWSRQDPQNQRNVWFSVFPSKGTCEGNASDAVFEGFLDKKAVFWNVIKASNQHDAARGDEKVRHPRLSAAEGLARAGQVLGLVALGRGRA